MQTSNADIDSGGSTPDDMASERLLSRCPVRVRRRVLWGECDPAGVVYTPRFGDYLTAAYAWFGRLVLRPALNGGTGERLITPMKAMSLEFAHVLRPDELFDMSVFISEIRTRTFDLVVKARTPDGEARFTGMLSPIVCDAQFNSAPLPQHLRRALEDYRDRCAERS